MTTEPRIAEEVADAEFEKFAAAMDLDTDTTKMVDEAATGFMVLRRTVTRALQRGSLVIDENGQPVFTPQYSKATDPITFHAPGGTMFSNMDKKKESEVVGKKFAAMGEMTRTSAAYFNAMDSRDLKICQALYLLFLS